jgi:hypothetical protein
MRPAARRSSLTRADEIFGKGNALVQGIQFGWLDVGGPDLGRFTPLPAVPAGQYVNFAAW